MKFKSKPSFYQAFRKLSLSYHSSSSIPGFTGSPDIVVCLPWAQLPRAPPTGRGLLSVTPSLMPVAATGPSLLGVCSLSAEWKVLALKLRAVSPWLAGWGGFLGASLKFFTFSVLESGWSWRTLRSGPWDVLGMIFNFHMKEAKLERFSILIQLG